MGPLLVPQVSPSKTTPTPEDNANAPSPFKVGTNAALMLTSASASNSSEDFGGAVVGPEILGTRTGRKDRRQEEGGGADKLRLLFDIIRDGDLFSLVRLVNI